MRRWLQTVLAALVALPVLVGTATPAAAEDTPVTASSPSVFGIGDSLFLQCGETLGLGSRSLGMIGWVGGTAQDMRHRLTSTAADWPYLTESSHAEEVADFRNASTWVIGLGTNDVRSPVSAAQYRASVDWFMTESAGRPVLWFNIYRPEFQTRVDVFNAVLAEAADRWPNLRVLDWSGYAAAHPEALLDDEVHLADYRACRDGRFSLVQAAAPTVEGQEPQASWVDPPAQPPPDPDPVTAAYEQAGGPDRLGAPTSRLRCELKQDGCFRRYARGAIAWSPDGGARLMSASVAEAWSTYGETGRLGYPTGDATCGLRNGGCRQRFEAGWMYWSPTTTPRDVLDGPFLDTYLARGAQNSNLGYPTGIPSCGQTAGGCLQHFQGGTMYWSRTTGSTVVAGAIRTRWRALGAHDGRLGYPTTDTICGLRGDGCGQNFAGGSIYWSPGTGARVVSGEVRRRWTSARGVYGSLGYPTMDTKCGMADGGCGQTFSGGSIYWSRATGARLVKGVIRTKWLDAGGVTGRYGYPIAEQRTIPGGWSQRFESGTLTYRDGRWA